MGVMDEEPLTEVTDIHRKVIKRLERINLKVMVEIDFPPYKVDIYIPDAHMAVEVDGPHHSETKDKKRDKYLMDTYNLPVIRLSIGQAHKAHIVKEVVQEAHDKWLWSADTRFKEKKEAMPWL